MAHDELGMAIYYSWAVMCLGTQDVSCAQSVAWQYAHALYKANKLTLLDIASQKNPSNLLLVLGRRIRWWAVLKITLVECIVFTGCVFHFT